MNTRIGKNRSSAEVSHKRIDGSGKVHAEGDQKNDLAHSKSRRHKETSICVAVQHDSVRNSETGYILLFQGQSSQSRKGK